MPATRPVSSKPSPSSRPPSSTPGGSGRVGTAAWVRAPLSWPIHGRLGALVGEQEQVLSNRAEVFQSLGVTGALELLNAYAKIPDPNLRKAILQLTKTIVKGDRQSEAA